MYTNYEGSEPHLYINVHPDDLPVVTPILEEMQRQHLRIWVNPVSEEKRYWLYENFPEQMTSSYLVLSFQSANTERNWWLVDDWITNARFARKEQYLIHLIPIEEPRGFRDSEYPMQDIVPVIPFHQYKSIKKFVSDLCRIPQLVTCIPPEQLGFEIEGDVLKRYTGHAKEVTVPDGLKEIGSHAFRGNESIFTVLLPESILKIGEGAFQNCTALSKVVYSRCKKYKLQTLGVRIRHIGAHAFANTSLKECDDLLLFVRTIGSYAFANTCLTEAWLHSDTHEVGHHAFADCHCLKKASTRAYGVLLEEDAFSGCEKLVEFQAKQIERMENVFRGCVNLKTIRLYFWVKYVHPECFQGLSALKKIELTRECIDDSPQLMEILPFSPTVIPSYYR